MRPLRDFGPLIALAAMIASFDLAYVVCAVPRSELAGRLASYSFALYLVLWMMADARRRRAVPCFDFGTLAAVYFPLSFVWYVIHSRGVRGLLVLLAVLGLLLAPWCLATAAWALLY
jgi:hypothetical protein